MTAGESSGNSAMHSEMVRCGGTGAWITATGSLPLDHNADALVHFHVAKLIYLGEVFAGDGYPTIDPAQGGSLEGLVKALDSWTNGAFQIVPVRGKVTRGSRPQSIPRHDRHGA